MPLESSKQQENWKITKPTKTGKRHELLFQHENTKKTWILIMRMKKTHLASPRDTSWEEKETAHFTATSEYLVAVEPAVRISLLSQHCVDSLQLLRSGLVPLPRNEGNSIAGHPRQLPAWKRNVILQRNDEYVVNDGHSHLLHRGRKRRAAAA